MLYIPKKIDEGALAEGMVEGGVEGDCGILLGQEGHPLLRDPGGHKVNLDYWPALKDKEVYYVHMPFIPHSRMIAISKIKVFIENKSIYLIKDKH